MKSHRLTNRELDIIKILWAENHPLLASEIQKKSPDLNINTVQATLRKLCSYGMVQVAGLIQTGTVFGRTYEPVISYNDYILMEFGNFFPKNGKNRSALVAALIEESQNKSEVLDELENLIVEYRKNTGK